MDRSAITAQLSTLVVGHVPRNLRKFHYRMYDDQPNISTLGFAIDPEPFDGRIIATTAEALIINTGRAQFAVVDRQLATQVPAVGTKIHVTPYARRRFDGRRVDTPEESTHYTRDGQPYTMTQRILGTPSIKLPVPTPQCPELQALIEQLENMPAPDRFRRIAHLLVDANAHDFNVVDPAPKDILSKPPEVGFAVRTAKFCGRVAVIYDRGMDAYAIELRRGVECLERHDDVYFDALGEVLERLIDDGQWRRIQVDVIADAPASAKH